MNVPTPLAPEAPLLITADPGLRDQVLLLCAAAGVAADVVDPVNPAADLRSRWRTSSGVILGPDVAGARVADIPLPRRDDVVIVSDRESPAIWRDAVTAGAERVIVLPAGQDDLVSWLADTVEGVGRACVIGVVGTRGGVGASTLSGALALCAARGARACLIDLDPLSGGLELVMGSEQVEGLRWSDVAVTEGRVGAAALRAALPCHRDVTLLSWSRGATAPISTSIVRSMVTAITRAFDVVVVDLPRSFEPAARETLAAVDHVLVIATDDVRSVAAASALLPTVAAYTTEVSAVVRTTPVRAAHPDSVASAMGLPLAGTVPTRRSVSRSIDEGLGPPRRGAMMRRCQEILATVRRPEAA